MVRGKLFAQKLMCMDIPVIAACEFGCLLVRNGLLSSALELMTKVPAAATLAKFAGFDEFQPTTSVLFETVFTHVSIQKQQNLREVVAPTIRAADYLASVGMDLL